MTSPYITFKKFLQKQKNNNFDHLSLVIGASKVKNIKVRNAYLDFLKEYVKYIAEKKDRTNDITQKSSKKLRLRDYSKTFLFLPSRPIKNSIICILKP
jgi:hypothetical protein